MLPTEGTSVCIVGVGLLAVVVVAYYVWVWANRRYHLWYDMTMGWGLFSALVQTHLFAFQRGNSVTTVWDRMLRSVPHDKPAFIQAETGQKLTFGDVEALSNQVANWVASRPELKPDSVVALQLENCIEYVPLWLGLAKAGIRVAMLNCYIKGKPLVHSVQVANCVAVITGSGVCAASTKDVIDGLREKGVSLFAELTETNDGSVTDPAFLNLRQAIAQQPPKVPKDFGKVRRAHIKTAMHDFGYIYTSGTTGLPKACRITHYKLSTMAGAFAVFCAQPDDVVYGSGMPLYHSAANLGVVHTIAAGATYIIRKKFSATNHFKDCTQYGATVMQYIGELCRYLLNAPATGFEDKHRVRLAIGNGLRPEIWNEFQRRFSIPEIGEFYGATEGNALLFNLCRNYEGQGAVARQGPLLQALNPVNLVKFDVVEEVPVRDKAGFCVKLSDGDVGELVIPIKMLPSPDGPKPNFAGYTSSDATEKKILRNVFAKGDAFFRTGDLMRKQSGLVFFVDRIGDTFRWKGENVSTMEVSEVLSTFPGVEEASVYGVQIPGKDGRACMVALRVQEGQTLDSEKFGTYCRANLPGYSIPLFVRFLTGMDTTGTFKHMKVEYKKQGFDPSQVTDKMWYFHPIEKRYKPLTAESYPELTGKLVAKL